jgi:hypothetical protein
MSCIALLLMVTLTKLAPAFGSDQTEGKKNQSQMTMLELQSEVMSFADRFSNVIGQAFIDLEAQAPTPLARYVALLDMIYSVSSAFTIAAEPNPSVALLDLVVLTTLGRMIYQEHYLKEFGDPAKVMVEGFRKGEADSWRIARKVLSPAEQRELRDLIREWRRNNPEQLEFTYIRFSDFSAERQKSTLA